MSGASVVGEGALASELLRAFLGWDPEANLLEFVAWATYLLAVGFAFLCPPLPESVAARPASPNN